MSFQSTLFDAADRGLNDFVITVQNVEGTPVFQLRAQGDMTEERSWWSVNVDTLTPATDPDA